MATTLSKEEYLKKYTSGGDTQAIKKKRRKKERINKIKSKSNVRIVDDDVDFKSLLPQALTNTVEDVAEDSPTVAEFVDERPDAVKHLEQYRKSDKWKTLQDDGRVASDESPPRRRRYDSGSDESPPRRKRHDSDSDQSPPRRKRHDSDSDQSPPRRKRHNSDLDQSPRRRKRHDSDSDQLPPRRKRHNSDSEQSPPRRKRHDSDSDQSPPRKNTRNTDSKRSHSRRKRHDSDQSPPRRKQQDTNDERSNSRHTRHDSDSDQSPPRRKQHDTNYERSNSRRAGHDSDSDQSPPRRKRTDLNSKNKRHKHHTDSDHSPETSRKSTHASKHSGSRFEGRKNDKGRATQVDEQGRAKYTLGGAKAGLQSGKDMRQEAKLLRQKEDAMFDQMDDEVLGRGAKTVVRKRRHNLEKEEEEEKRKQARQEEMKAKYQKWGKGLKQAELQAVSVEAAVHEAAKPLARYSDDKDLDSELREQEREGDPMLAFIKKKKKTKQSNQKELPVYKGPEPPPNRFHIRPGYRWDGVDRSNGFEKQLFAKKSEKTAIKEMAYKWSVEDM